ncbi:MAG TPA: hypothetical protein PLX59_04955 [Candidatus Cloacimonadota bacterium]|nr:hypothetical protein [Candidatus Cloacimonadota bacterium]
MKLSTGILSEQNLWLKLLIFSVACVLGFDAKIRQLLLLVALFLVYYLCEPAVFSKLLMAMRRIMPFVTAYWLFATLFGTEFPEMLQFSLQIIYFLVISIYCLGTTDTRHFMLDTRKMQRYRWFNQVTYVVLATALFIRSYFELLQQHKLNQAASLSSVFTYFAEVIKQNYASAKQVETEVESSIREKLVQRDFFVGQNLVAFGFLTALVLVGSV